MLVCIERLLNSEQAYLAPKRSLSVRASPGFIHTTSYENYFFPIGDYFRSLSSSTLVVSLYFFRFYLRSWN